MRVGYKSKVIEYISANRIRNNVFLNYESDEEVFIFENKDDAELFVSILLHFGFVDLQNFIMEKIEGRKIYAVKDRNDNMHLVDKVLVFDVVKEKFVKAYGYRAAYMPMKKEKKFRLAIVPCVTEVKDEDKSN